MVGTRGVGTLGVAEGIVGRVDPGTEFGKS